MLREVNDGIAGWGLTTTESTEDTEVAIATDDFCQRRDSSRNAVCVVVGLTKVEGIEVAKGVMWL